jgi:putative hydrolase of the HAD superfamily
MIHTIIFDLDDTLYPPQVGIMEQIRVLIHTYICNHLNLPDDEADALRRHYFQAYGTTMRGLQLNHQIDADDFLHHVHDIPLHRYLKPNPRLGEVLAAIPHQKVIFTNASREHAKRVLELLEVGHHFARIVDVRDVDYESKPQPAAYRRICEILDVAPQHCLLVEDNVRNLEPAKALGMTTVLVQEDPVGDTEAVDYAIPRIEEIGQVVGQIPDGDYDPIAHPRQSGTSQGC